MSGPLSQSNACLTWRRACLQVGAFVVTRKGAAKDASARPKDVDREFIALFSVSVQHTWMVVAAAYICQDTHQRAPYISSILARAHKR
jgi:hypothetical protein